VMEGKTFAVAPESSVVGEDSDVDGSRATSSKPSAWREGRYLSFLAIGLYLVFWFLLTKDGFGLIGALKFPTPRMVVRSAWINRDLLLNDVAVSWLRMITGWTTGVILGVGLGLLMYRSKKVFYFCDPIIEGMRPVPAIAMVPFFILWFGLSERGKFLLIVGGVFAILVVSTLEAARNIPRIYIRAAESLGASNRYILRRIVVPCILPQLIGALRVSSALAFTLVVAAEYIGAQSGLGYRIIYAQNLFQTDLILLGVVLFGLMSGSTDLVIRHVIRRLTRWTEREV
jgi:ABC-type nitrate/sulfonate/bicarbonate transport system permease component